MTSHALSPATLADFDELMPAALATGASATLLRMPLPPFEPPRIANRAAPRTTTNEIAKSLEECEFIVLSLCVSGAC